MSGHTPGPWSVVAGDDYLVISDATPEQFPHRFKGDDLGRFVASIGNRAGDFGEADAHLIAAAPDLLEALKALYAAVREQRWSAKESEMVRAAIEKAESSKSSVMANDALKTGG